MNVWIFQHQTGVDVAAELRKPDGDVRIWNVDRYFREETTPHIEEGDIVLQWQPGSSDDGTAGIHAFCTVKRSPYYEPNEKSNYQVEVIVREVYPRPLTRARIRQEPRLRDLQVLRMPNHAVFKVTPEEWEVLQGLLADLTG